MKQLLACIALLVTTSLTLAEPITIHIKTPYGSISCTDYNTLEDVFQICRQHYQCDRTASIKLYIGNKEVLEGSEYARKTRLRDFNNKELYESSIQQTLPTTHLQPTYHERYFYSHTIFIKAPNGQLLEFYPEHTFAYAFTTFRREGLCQGDELSIAFHKNGYDCKVTEYDTKALQTFQQVLDKDINNTEFILIQSTSQAKPIQQNNLDLSPLEFITGLFYWLIR